MDMTLEAREARRNYKKQYRSKNRSKINAQQRCEGRNGKRIKGENRLLKHE